MMLGFKRRFAPFVLDGSKRHTIRERRPRLGETLHCYVDPRQKSMALLGRWRCTKVEDLFLRIGEPSRLTINGVILSIDEANAFAWRDGFRNSGPDGAFLEMQRYWAKPNRMMYAGYYVIHWDYDHPVERGASKRTRRAPTEAPNPARTREVKPPKGAV